VLIAASAYGVLDRQAGTRYVDIKGESGEWLAPLNKDADYEIPGPLGLTHVHIYESKVAVVDSPCANQLCVLSGAISEPNQWIACLPNKVFVHITSSGSGQGDIDATAF